VSSDDDKPDLSSVSVRGRKAKEAGLLLKMKKFVAVAACGRQLSPF